jgi:8-oxo-dGTP diphosphatase
VEPRLTVTIVPFQIRQGVFCIGTLRSPDDTVTLPSGPPDIREPLDAAAERLMVDIAGYPPAYMEQLYTISIERRDPWRIIVSYLVIVPPDADRPLENLVWESPNQVDLRRETDRMLLDYAMIRVRAKLGYTNLALHLMPPAFTLTNLQGVYEQVLGRSLDKRNFRRRMVASRMLEGTGVFQREGSHRPAELYRFAADSDQSTYLTPPWATIEPS